MANVVSITFGIIVLNGEPFNRYNLRSIYPFAHEIIVVEGAVEAARNITGPDGHSTDGTLDTLKQFKLDEDPENKLIIISKDGLWSEKDEMSRAYANRATGDYLWQVDIDEFYKAKDIKIVLEMLRNDPTITCVSFKQISFWGGFNYWADGWYLWDGAGYYHRLFKWDPSYTYANHRPPTVLDAQGRDLRTKNWIRGQEMAEKGVYLYHYSLVFPKQVVEKSEYYSSVKWSYRAREQQRWAHEIYFKLQNPFKVHNVYWYPSWLERFQGVHPEQIQLLQKDLDSGTLTTEQRPTDDIEKLLNSKFYTSIKYLLIIFFPVGKFIIRLYRLLRQIITNCLW